MKRIPAHGTTSMLEHDRHCAMFSAMFGKKGMISKREAALFFGCCTRTITRKFSDKFIQAPGGLRISKSDILAAL